MFQKQAVDLTKIWIFFLEGYEKIQFKVKPHFDWLNSGFRERSLVGHLGHLDHHRKSSVNPSPRHPPFLGWPIGGGKSATELHDFLENIDETRWIGMPSNFCVCHAIVEKSS